MGRYSLASLLLVITIVALGLGWYLDHRRLTADNRKLNQEAGDLMRADLSDMNIGMPFHSVESDSAKLAVLINHPNLSLATFQERQALREELAAAVAGIDGHPTGVAAGMPLADARKRLSDLGFTVPAQPAADGYLRCTKPWQGGLHHVNLKMADDTVTEAFEMCIDP